MKTLCEWPVSYESCGATEGDPGATPPVAPSYGSPVLDALSEEQRETFERMAAEMLWNWTDRQFGVCSVTLRPCRSDCSSADRWLSTFWGRGPYPWGSLGAGGWVPVLIDGEWFNVGCQCASRCSCSETRPSALRLPGPVAAVTSVRVDGILLDPSEYKVRGDLLIRVDGSPWPTCQDLLAEPTEPDTFEVIYDRGTAVPIGGQLAAGVLARELALASCGDKACQLPQRIQTVTRQGLTIGIVDAFQGLEGGRTGIWIIDSWVSSARAGSDKAGAGVRSPDYRSGVRRGY